MFVKCFSTSYLKYDVRQKLKQNSLNPWKTSKKGQITFDFIPEELPKHVRNKTTNHKKKHANLDRSLWTKFISPSNW